jgi:integrase
VEALRTHRARQHAERLALGPAWADHGFVFTRVDGEPLRGTHILQHYFLPLLKRAGLPKFRFHDLRHTCATLLLEQGVNANVVQELLGHSDIAMTLGIYGHVLPTMQQGAEAVMDTLLTHVPVSPVAL